MAVAAAAGFACAAPAAATNRNGMWQWGGSGECIDVPNGDFSSGIRLIIYRCQNSINQWFLLQEDGHLVANAGRPNNRGLLMCVEAIGDYDRAVPVLMPCRPLRLGDRQWWRRDPFGYLQTNVRSRPRFGRPDFPYAECLAVPERGIGESVPLVMQDCRDGRGVQTMAWYPYPYTEQDQSYDRAAEEIARRGGHLPGQTIPTTDPARDAARVEQRAAWENNVRQYGPYMVVRDTRTGFCLQPHADLSAVVAGNCGSGAQRFHFNPSDGLIRQISSRDGVRGVTGLCVAAPATEGNRLTLSRCNRARPEQRWWVINGQIQSQSRAAGNRCWDVGSQSQQNGAFIIAWRCDTGRPGHQAFDIGYETAFAR